MLDSMVFLSDVKEGMEYLKEICPLETEALLDYFHATYVELLNIFCLLESHVLMVKIITARSNFKSRSHYDIAHLHPANIPAKYQLPTLYCFQDITQIRFYRSRLI